MDSRRWPRPVENAINHCNIVAQSGESRDCKSCGQLVGTRSGPFGNWDAFPAGVKFDPSDEELLQHLKAKTGLGNVNSHPLIDNFISVLDGEDGICQTHPEHLPGVKKDGSSRHFFHRPAKAYTTGTRKRRKIHTEDDEPGVETRWHKTGKTRSVSEGGHILGWKKIMVLYRNTGAKKAKPEKTNWILHQYHLGPNEEETDGELVVCKVFYQKQPRQCTGGRQGEGAAEMEKVDLNQGRRAVSMTCLSEVSRGTPVTPKLDAPQRPDATAKMRGAPTQSSRGSELTVIGLDTQAAVVQELSSTPVCYRNEVLISGGKTGSFVTGGQTKFGLLKCLRQTFPEDYSAEWTEGFEEVSTSGKPCQNENDNQGGRPSGLQLREQEDLNQCIPFFGCESQQPFLDEEIDLSLLCDEELGVDSLLREVGLNYEFGSPEEPYVSNPNEDYPAVDDTLLNTPPALNMDFIFSSQEAMDVIAFKPPSISLDNDDSLSST